MESAWMLRWNLHPPLTCVFPSHWSLRGLKTLVCPAHSAQSMSVFTDGCFCFWTVVMLLMPPTNEHKQCEDKQGALSKPQTKQEKPSFFLTASIDLIVCATDINTPFENNREKLRSRVFPLYAQTAWTALWMCVKSQSEQRELYLKHLTRAQASFYSATVQPVLWVDVCRLGQAHSHSCESLGLCVSYQSDHPLQSDRGCQAAAGHSQPAAACRDVATYCHWLYTKHPQLVQSLSPWWWGGGRRHLFILYWQKNPVLHSRETPYRQGWATCPLLFLHCGGPKRENSLLDLAPTCRI